MTAALTAALVTSAGTTAAGASEGVDTGVPPLAWGLGTLLFFMILLGITLAFGRGRG